MIMRLAWLTDPHFDFVDADTAAALLAAVVAGQPQGVLLSGDLATAPLVTRWLEILDQALPVPVWFVLGNHDYYHGSRAAVRAAVGRLAAASRRLTWLDASEPLALTPTLGLVGHEGWGDGRLGDYLGSRVQLNDFVLIEELAGLGQAERGRRLAALGAEAAAHLGRVLPAALARFEHVLVLTHVPPLAAACLHRGQPSAPDWLPHFACQATGEVLLAAAEAWPQRQITVLAGHSHCRADVRPRPNLRVRVGAAEYRRPAIEDWLELD
jgi:3',5'-cyclic AMP phosphodiesterase CpdA